MSLPPPVWRLSLEVPAAAEPAFAAAFEGLCDSFVSQERRPGVIALDAYRDEPPDRRAVELRLQLASASTGVPVPALTITSIQPRDWLTDSERSFPPIPAGRFFIHPRRFGGAVPAGQMGIAMDAGMAFGSGHHGSTAGCLRALSAAHGTRPRSAADLGCGSGILAIAIAKKWHCPVTAVDIDPRSVTVAAANARINGVAGLVRCGWADGWRQGAARACRDVDLIVCNILPRPVKRMLPGIAARLAPGGTAMLGGFLLHQSREMRAACRQAGLALSGEVSVDGWRTLIVRRRA